MNCFDAHHIFLSEWSYGSYFVAFLVSKYEIMCAFRSMLRAGDYVLFGETICVLAWMEFLAVHGFFAVKALTCLRAVHEVSDGWYLDIVSA